MNRKYNLRLDLQFRCNNSVMKFRQSDNKTSDFFMRITSGGELFNIDNAIVILAVIKPNQTVQSQFLEVKEGKVYADLNPNMKDQVGIYKAQALLVYEDERVSTDVIEYEVLEDNILNQLEATVSTTEEFTILQQMLSRLSIVENSENLRVENENSRVEAEKLREQAIEKIKNDAAKLVTDTKKEISDYKDAKDISINLDLTKYKEATTQDINDYKNTKNTEIDNYKNAKDLAIDNDLKQYKTNTTEDITQFKNTKNNELDEYKNAKDLEIDNYVISKNLEIDNYKSAKDIEIDNYKKLKDTEINAKLGEVDTAETLRVSAEQKRVIDHQAREQFLNSFESQLAQIENKNIEQDNRLKEVERVNKTQQVYINGLFNENKDGRLSVEGEGNDLKLEGSKAGLVEVDKVVGNTINARYLKIGTPTIQSTQNYNNVSVIDKGDYYECKATALVSGVVSWNYWYGKLNLGLSVGSVYTVVVYDCPETSQWGKYIIRDISMSENLYSTNGVQKWKITAVSDDLAYGFYSVSKSASVDEEVIINFPKKILILEGDYTNKPIPNETFEGLQSSFESNLVTQEMVEQGLESEENLGKYKVPVKVVGKNLFDANFAEIGSTNWNYGGGDMDDSGNNYARVPMSNLIKVKPNTNYVFNIPNWCVVSYFDINKNFISGIANATAVNITTPSNTYYLRFRNYNPYSDGSALDKIKEVQIEEGTVVTDYEDYFERTTNVYLNSPLLEGDEIVCKEDGLYHYHKMKQVVLDGSEDWIKADTSITTTHIKTSVFLLEVTGSNAGSLCDKFVNNTNMTSDTEFYYYNTSFFGGSKLVISINNSKLSTQNLTGFKAWLKANPIKVVYELAEPWYEPIQSDKLLLECANDSTLYIDSIVPVESVKASYTGNIPSVYAIEETGITNTEDISVTQTAVDFLLMSSMGEVMMMSFNENTRGGNQMGAYFASRIMKGALKYEDVIRKYPEFKDDIDFILRSEGYENLIVEVQ